MFECHCFTFQAGDAQAQQVLQIQPQGTPQTQQPPVKT